jgi:Mn2+/Fe2+ NRAMP family transporter
MIAQVLADAVQFMNDCDAVPAEIVNVAVIVVPLVTITLFVQVIAVTLLPSALVFLILLLNQEELVGKYRNSARQNLLAGSIVAVIIVLSTFYGLGTLFPGLFGGST